MQLVEKLLLIINYSYFFYRNFMSTVNLLWLGLFLRLTEAMVGFLKRWENSEESVLWNSVNELFSMIDDEEH